MNERQNKEMFKNRKLQEADIYDDNAKLAQQLWNIKLQIKELKRIETDIADILKLSADNKTAIFGNFIYALKMRKGNILYTAIPELSNVDLEQYRAPEIVYFELIKK